MLKISETSKASVSSYFESNARSDQSFFFMDDKAMYKPCMQIAMAFGCLTLCLEQHFQVSTWKNSCHELKLNIEGEEINYPDLNKLLNK